LLREDNETIRQVGYQILQNKKDTKNLKLKSDDIIEWIRCRNNILYYIYNYVKFEEINGGISSYKEGTNFHPKHQRFVKSVIRYHRAIEMASRQLGKALDISTPLLKPTGQWTTMGDIKEGEYLYGSDGKPTKVIAKTEVMYDRNCYNIEFDNGQNIKCDENHLWYVSNTTLKIDNMLMSTKEIFDETEGVIKKWSQAVNFRISIVPVINKTRSFLLDPYVLGLWLGDGSSSDGRIATSLEDYPEVKSIITARGYKCSDLKLTNKTKNSGSFTIYGLHKILRTSDLLNNKNIPRDYFYGDTEQRLELLRGLLDSDGYCNKKCGTVQFYQKNFMLLSQVRYLLATLGIKSRLKSRVIKEQTYYTLTFTTNKYRLFNLERKFVRQTGSGNRQENYCVFIKKIEKVESVPVKCIQVDAPDGVFLCGETLIPTHNSTISAAVISWFATFFPRSEPIILNFQKDTAYGNLKKIRFVINHLPDFLKLDIMSKSELKSYFEMSNGSMIKVFYPSTTHHKSTLARSLTSSLLYIDEAAFIPGMFEIFGLQSPVFW